ncbi:MAG: (d)CMP kinase, partial [Lacticaseibacillus paracasei]
EESMQIAIDGPASAGKSTIAKRVAKELGVIYCDTGAMYRTVTYMAIKDQLGFGDEAAIMQHLANMTIRFEPGDPEQRVLMNDEDVTLAIREPAGTNHVSQVSALPKVRTELVKRQRDIAASSNIVMDGRDIGTTVLPNAEVKIYMVASVAERAKRRYKENIQKGIETPLATLEQEIAERDRKDSHRAVSPLRQASDAIRIDTTSMTIDEVVERILSLIGQVKTK